MPIALFPPRSCSRPDADAVPFFGGVLRRRLSVLLVCALAVGVAAGLGDPASLLAQRPDLVVLLRGIALIKATFALVALAAVLWRCGHALRPGHAVGYAAGCALMAGAAMSVWQLSSMGFASVAFHSGWIALFAVSWVDGVGPALRRRSARADVDA
jgi:hypothetical protein